MEEKEKLKKYLEDILHAIENIDITTKGLVLKHIRNMRSVGF